MLNGFMVFARLPGSLGLMLLAILLFSTVKDRAAFAGAGSGPKIFFEPVHRSERVVNFPSNYSLGLLTLCPVSGVRGKIIDASAKGRVVIPAGYCSLFQATQYFFAHPEICASLPPDCFDSIQLSSTSLSDSEDDEADRALSHIGHLKGLRQVILDKSDATDIGIAHLAELPNVQYISFFGNPCSGSCLKQLATMKSLHSLRVSAVAIHPQYFKYLGQVHLLDNLALSRCQLTDSDLQFLLKCEKIGRLDISANPKLTDASMQYISKVKTLRYLLISDTAITLHGLTSLKGLSIALIVYSPHAGDANALTALKRLFPGALIIRSQNTKKLDEETGTLYAPLH